MNRRMFAASSAAAALGLAAVKTAAQTGTPSAGTDSANPYVAGTGLSLVPSGNPNTVEVVAKGMLIDGNVPLIVRNTTEFPIFLDDVIGTLRDSAGKLIDTVSFAELAPKNLLPNGVACGSAYFSEDNVPLDAQVELVAKFEGGPNADYVELPITEIEANSDGFVGAVTNETTFPVDSVQVVGVTLAPDGTPVGYFSGYVSDPIAPGAIGYFDGYLRGQPSQDYIVAAYSLNF